MKRWLLLEEGTLFEGSGFGAEGDITGEVVFNTGMTGYQETLTDPSYCGQIVTMTYPLIGNYGVNDENRESSTVHLKGFIVREWCRHPSHFKSAGTLNDYLSAQGVMGLEQIDTRALVRIIREKGTMNGLLTSAKPEAPEEHLARLRRFSLHDQIRRVTPKQVIRTDPQETSPGSLPAFHIALMDCGTKENICRELLSRHCAVTRYPAGTAAGEILAGRHDGIVLSNGPGDPKDCPEVIEAIRGLWGRIPIFGICLGHQLIALARGADTEKLKYGHRGANHPVRDLRDGRTAMTSQNHGYTVVPASVEAIPGMSVSHLNINDGTIEGMVYADAPVCSVQFHPEGSPGPRDTGYLFDRFLAMMKENGPHAAAS